jgi:hypothetical protein
MTKDTKDSLMDDLFRSRAALSEYRSAVKAKQSPDLQLYEAWLELNVRVAERGLSRLTTEHKG